MNRAVPFSKTSAAVLFSEEVRANDEIISVQVVSAGSATVVFEVSNDSVTWVATSGNSVGVSGTAVTSTTTAGISIFMNQARFFRARVSAYTSGTVSGVAVFGKGWSK
jgi:hypothetical protein